MFPMTPAMSWLLMIVLALIIAVPLIVAYRVRRRRERAAVQNRFAPVIELRPRPVPAEHQLALVPELRELQRSRHLALVQRAKPVPSPALYDWQTQGI